MQSVFSAPVTTPAAARAETVDAPPFVSLLTDFGSRDPSAGICRGVILRIAPHIRLVDISHDVEKYSIVDGAQTLWCALPYLPIGVHMAVVDPGVGTPRLPIVVEARRGDLLVGPDNGLLLPAAERLGGAVRAHVLEREEFQLPAVSASFHGRDIFAPAAAHLALGVPPQAFGRPLAIEALVRLELPVAEIRPGELRTAIVYVDTFGNLKLAGDASDLRSALGALDPGVRLRLTVGERGRPIELSWVETFGAVEPGGLLCYEDSYGRLCVAVNRGDAAHRLRLTKGSPVSLRRA